MGVKCFDLRLSPDKLDRLSKTLPAALKSMQVLVLHGHEDLTLKQAAAVFDQLRGSEVELLVLEDFDILPLTRLYPLSPLR